VDGIVGLPGGGERRAVLADALERGRPLVRIDRERELWRDTDPSGARAGAGVATAAVGVTVAVGRSLAVGSSWAVDVGDARRDHDHGTAAVREGDRACPDATLRDQDGTVTVIVG
jgi:hypothetical protein